MIEELSWQIYAALALLSAALLLRVAVPRIDRSRLPPTAVRPHVVFGNKVPANKLPWTYWQEVGKGRPMFTWWLGRTPLIVINGYRASQDILEKQYSGSTADRPPSYMAGETMSGGKRILLVRYGDRWRRMRKVLHQGLSPKMATSFQPVQTKAALTLIDDITSDPDRPCEKVAHRLHVQSVPQVLTKVNRYAASAIMSIAYGKTTPTSYHDPEVQAVQRCLGRLGFAAQPGRFLVDSGLPWLRLLPGKWKSQGKAWHREELALFSEQLDKARQNTSSDSFSRYLFEHQKEFGLSDSDAAYLAGSQFGAGSDTTAAHLAFTIMACVVFPEAAARAQKELDEVIGRERVPTFDDQADLPYVQAFIKEVHRWRPVSAGGFLHALSEPIAYDGYLLPKGAAIVGNHYAIMHDETVFPEPQAFKPERWFADATDKTLRTDINHVSYGFGRRACIGRNVADRSIFINTALLLWAFSYAKAKDREGQVIEIDTYARTNTANSHPLPFRAEIKPRFDGMAKVVSEAQRSAA